MSDARETIKFATGAMWESYPWEIHVDAKCASYGGRPCPHCHSQTFTGLPRTDGSTYELEEWICPRVVVALNEAGCNSTGVCLDCILEAAAQLDGNTIYGNTFSAGFEEAIRALGGKR